MRTIKLGVAGLGRAFAAMLPAFVRDPRVGLAAAADPRPEALARFERDFGGKGYASVAELCRDAALDAIYVATPHQFHPEHARLAMAAGKHVLVEKPMALTLEECRAMTAERARAGVQLVVGHSHSFDRPIAETRKLIERGEFGRVRMITAFNFTDFLYRPRRPEELDTGAGGGAVFNQGAHQVDVVRLLAGGRAASVRAAAGAWDAARPAEGAYSCLLSFEGGAFATLVYSGYAHFDSDELCGWIGESGHRKDPDAYGAARRSLAQAKDEVSLKNARNYGGERFQAPGDPGHHPHFGPIVVSCERADLRPLPDRIVIYADTERRVVPLPAPKVPRAEVIDELYEAIVNATPPVHGGEWATATLEVCLAILRSAREGKEIALTSQTGLRT